MYSWTEAVNGKTDKAPHAKQEETRSLLNVIHIGLLEFKLTERFTGYTLPNVLHVVDDGLEVRCRIVRASDEDIVRLSIRGGCVKR